jgi:hypothetical protein
MPVHSSRFGHNGVREPVRLFPGKARAPLHAEPAPFLARDGTRVRRAEHVRVHDSEREAHGPPSLPKVRFVLRAELVERSGFRSTGRSVNFWGSGQPDLPLMGPLGGLRGERARAVVRSIVAAN